MDRGTDTDVAASVVVRDDPINIGPYVSWVFRWKLGVEPGEATALMLAIHEGGQATVFRGPLAECEQLVADLHVHGLWATLERGR
jgi:ATP-dependent Clp protease adaptor protein ClpS